jgi:hypothetical protein
METTGESHENVPDRVTGGPGDPIRTEDHKQSSDDRTIIRKLIELRSLAGLSQNQLAKRMRRSVHEIRKAEERLIDSYIDIDFFVSYLHALGYTVQCVPEKVIREKSVQFFTRV